MIETTLAEVLIDISRYSWKECVYINDSGELTALTSCLVIDDSDAEIGADGFTPLEAEKRNMIEFLSIHDLQGVMQNLQHLTAEPSIALKCSAAIFYFKNDAFMPPELITGS